MEEGFVIDGTLKPVRDKPLKAVDGFVDVGHYVDRSETDSPVHGLLMATHLAFQHHLPLQLSPDVVMISILQSFKIWLHQQNPNEDGAKVVLTVRNDALLGGSREEWAKTLAQFPKLIADRVDANLVDLCRCDFTTSTDDTRAAAYITLMDVASPWAAYEVYSFCGIPKLYLTGVKGDWVKIAARVALIQKLYPKAEWWTTRLATVVAQFVRLFDEAPDAAFWKSFYKYNSWSGGDTVTGHINAFFPYVRERESKAFVENTEQHPKFSAIPTMICTASIQWVTPRETVALTAKSDILRIKQHEGTGALEPVSDWVVSQ